MRKLNELLSLWGLVFYITSWEKKNRMRGVNCKHYLDILIVGKLIGKKMKSKPFRKSLRNCQLLESLRKYLHLRRKRRESDNTDKPNHKSMEEKRGKKHIWQLVLYKIRTREKKDKKENPGNSGLVRVTNCCLYIPLWWQTCSKNLHLRLTLTPGQRECPRVGFMILKRCLSVSAYACGSIYAL